MISILLATYNGEKHIKECIDSIINQTFTDWELLIGFNGTTDNSKNIISEYNDSRIKVFDYGDDKGKSKTLNKLLRESRYEWCAIQDDDDIWDKYKLEKQLKYINDFDIIGTQLKYCDINSNIIDGNPKLKLNDSEIKFLTIRGNNQIANSSSLIKKSILIDVDGWDEELPALEDFDLWIRLIVRGYIFLNLDDFLLIHRKHQNSNFNTLPIQEHNRIMYGILIKNNIIKNG